MTASSAWDRFCENVRTAAVAGAAEQFERLNWNSEQIERAQSDGLRALLLYAAEHSPFHQRRLTGIDLTTIDPTHLSALPVMTKTDMMDHLDDVFTDRRLCRSDVEAALGATGAQGVTILDDYVALASGGCSGRRGLFVFDQSAMTAYGAALGRSPFTTPASDVPSELRMAMVAAPSAVHATGFFAALTATGDWPIRYELVPATLPLSQIVKRLNTLQPPTLGGYASILEQLAHEALAGRLRIAPAQVTASSETLLPEIRSLITEAFGVPVLNFFACTEGLAGKTAKDDDVFTLNTDMCIVELVDADNRPVPPGVASDKVLITNLTNLIQPLIRYELNDVFVRQPDAPAHGHLRARVRGRSDEIMRYTDAEVHPIVIRSMMVKSPDVIDYQVHQTESGIDVFAVTTDNLDVDDLTVQLRRALADAGLDGAHVAVKRVDGLERQAASGKLRRFVPIAR